MFTILACSVAALVALRLGAPRHPGQQDRGAPVFDRIYLRNVDYSSYVGGEKSFTLKADEIVHRKRKLGPLTLNPIKEVEMSGVEIEIYQGGPPAGGNGLRAQEVDLPLQTILKESLSAKDLGFVTRVLMNRFHLVLLRGGEEQLSIVAGTASVGLDSAVLRIDHDFTLSTRAGEQLVAKSAEWRFDSRRLDVRGSYVHQDRRGSRRGEAASFRIGPDGRLTRVKKPAAGDCAPQGALKRMVSSPCNRKVFRSAITGVFPSVAVISS